MVPTSKVSANSNTLLLLQPYHTAPAHGALETLDAYNTDETGKQLTYVNDTTVIPVSPYKKSIGSFKFDGTTDRLEIKHGLNITLDGAFTFELWAKHRRGSGSGNYMNYYGNNILNGIYFQYNGNQLQFGPSQVSSGFYTIASFTPVANTWYHIAVTRDGSNTLRVYVNGVELGLSLIHI